MKLQMYLLGHIKVLGGPYVAGGPDVKVTKILQICLRSFVNTHPVLSGKYEKKTKYLLLSKKVSPNVAK